MSEQVRALHKNSKISSQTARLMADAIRGLDVDRALAVLALSPKKSARLYEKVLKSAIANAEHNDGLDIDELKVSTVFVDESVTHKRIRARAKGRANRILKRTSHITVAVAEK